MSAHQQPRQPLAAAPPADFSSLPDEPVMLVFQALGSGCGLGDQLLLRRATATDMAAGGRGRGRRCRRVFADAV